MKKNSCTPINPKKYSCYGLKKIHTRNLITKKNSCGSKIPLPPITFLMVRPLVNADQIERRVNDVPNSQAFLCWKLSTSEKDLSFYFFFFLKYVYFKIRQQVRVFYELAKWHPTLDSIPSFYEVKIYKKNRFVYKTWIYERKVWTRLINEFVYFFLKDHH